MTEPYSMPLTNADRLAERVSDLESNPHPSTSKMYRDMLTPPSRDYVALLESQRDELREGLIECREALLDFTFFARKDTQPTTATDAVKRAGDILTRIAAGKPDPRLALTVQDLEAALQWRTLMDPEQHSGYYYPHTAKLLESIISALEPADGAKEKP